MNYRFHPHARGELDDAVSYYQGIDVKLAQDFLDEVARTIDRILAFPRAWQRLAPNIGRCRLNRFPYGLVYKTYPSEVLILAVMHLHRQNTRQTDFEIYRFRRVSRGRLRADYVAG
jgi:plasmid stabilization system protein ParE